METLRGKENKKIYVCMTDKFLSGWGRAENKINKYIVICDNRQQAETILKNASERKEMKYININYSLPYYDKNRYLLSFAVFKELGEIWTKGYKKDKIEILQEIKDDLKQYDKLLISLRGLDKAEMNDFYNQEESLRLSVINGLNKLKEDFF